MNGQGADITRPWSLKLTASVANFVGFLLLSYAFMIMVMTAIAQQEVVDRMARDDLTIGYSSAYTLVKELDVRRREIPSLRKREQVLSGQITKQQSDFRQARERFDLAWQSFLPLAQRIARNGSCELSLQGAEDLAAKRSVWSEVQECAGANSLSPSLARLVGEFANSDRNVEAAAVMLTRAAEVFTRTKEEFDAVRAQLKEAVTVNPDEEKARGSFSEINVLRETWMLGGGFLVAFPPPMLQILLALVAGVFGALLVTLVLIVYPRAKLDISSTQETWARIGLGGLISVGVYIVLLGGSAVLGSSPGTSAAGTNYMAFCSIGILAGMFSDRVAGWLSEKANAFFRPEPGQ